MKEVIDDLNRRGLALAGVIATDSSGQIVVLTYDPNGNATKITRPVDEVSIAEKTGPNTIIPLMGLRTNYEGKAEDA